MPRRLVVVRAEGLQHLTVGEEGAPAVGFMGIDAAAGGGVVRRRLDRMDLIEVLKTRE